MTAAIPTWIVDAGTLAGIFAGVCAAIGVIAKSPARRPLGWMWRHLVGDPMSTWARREVRRAVDLAIDERLMAPNGGKSLADLARKVDRITTHLQLDDD